MNLIGSRDIRCCQSFFFSSEEKAKKSVGQVDRGLFDGGSRACSDARVGVGEAVLSGGDQVEIHVFTLLEFTLIENLQLTVDRAVKQLY